MPFLAYRDKMRAEGPNHFLYILGMALMQNRIDTEVTICILSQSWYLNVSVGVSETLVEYMDWLPTGII